ncbi:protein serine/threonine kinase, putative [Entamoeba invadens IP1]|uniref:Protein serine/threonine kinase, putative n=1 Tax=Entamoeba invadens IP1 TaxID=370355 RepID=A0A0A1U9R3_ENTIV|nr:protein serine/threonine kinase, putative [Entamoeba invadens IP1]ELP89851.1 protein serine/threonine kinase, putative [Entamoeba invadens IP1]|eukprot:XP_004256622.1 protein serine/threonine kinase, putative [Entamoeba invadens IP1]
MLIVSSWVFFTWWNTIMQNVSGWLLLAWWFFCVFKLRCHVCGDTCVECAPNYYSPSCSISCRRCDTTCVTCNSSSGYCTSCQGGYATTNKVCTMCASGYYEHNNACKQCKNGTHSSTSGSTVCAPCQGGYYSLIGDSECVHCDDLCGDHCDAASGKCLSCISGYVLQPMGECVGCESGQYANAATNSCKLCAAGTYSKQNAPSCTNCGDGTYSKEGATSCTACASVCNTCDKTTGVCLTCYSGYQLNALQSCEICQRWTYSYGKNCVECEEMKYQSEKGQSLCLACNTDCASCDKTDGKCTTCKAGYGYDSGICTLCHDGYYSTGGNGSCIACPVICDNCIKKSGACSSCSSGYKKVGDNCTSCASNGNCNSCDSNENESNRVCVECAEKYFLNEEHNRCYLYNTIDPNCDKCSRNAKVCVACSEKFVTDCTSCYKCDASKVKIDTQSCMKCFDAINNCNSCIFTNTNFVCVGCFAPYVVSTNSKSCVLGYTEGTHYNYGTNKSTLNDGNCVRQVNTTCIQCENTLLVNGSCIGVDNNCVRHSTTTCDVCATETITTANCGETTNNCKYTKVVSGVGECLQCKSDNLCGLQQQHCAISNNSFCYLAVTGYSSTTNGIMECVSGTLCIQFENNEIDCKCANLYVFDSNYKCHDDVKCSTMKSIYCVGCVTNHHIEDYTCTQNTIANCEIQNKDICIKCDATTITSDGKCYSTDNLDCAKFHGCLRCADMYYIENGVCVQCEYPCIHCSNLTFCTKCDRYSYPNTNGNCTTLGEIITTCLVMMPNYDGCAICKDGYKRSTDGTSCDKCDESCEKCDVFGNCIDCNNTFYRIDTSDKYCRPQSELIGCLNTSIYGCLICEYGYYIHTNVCDKCDNNCTLCTSPTECTSCIATHILVDSQCVQFSTISNCISASNNKCAQCADNFKVNTEGTQCNKKTNYGLVVVLLVVLTLLFLVFLFVVTYTNFYLFNKKQKKDRERGVCVFPMKKSNILMKVLGNNIFTNKTEICFNEVDDFEDLLKVNVESRELLCVGNSSKGVLKIQITTQSSSEKYTIRTEPKIVSLKSGFACEFEVFLTPHCTLTLEDKIAVVTLDISTGGMATFPINLFVKTEKTTRLDFDDIVEEKKLGEGSFGIVYKGNYRGNVVAIKKMKQIENSLDDNSIDEFTKEVGMLDKFRSEYIIHFYGAVFIPSKVCMVTEFAQYGSLQDLMKHKTSDEVDMNLRIKIMTDAAKGISYLHENGILHRDIKPDNILVLSLDSNENVNAKLTDFGSSRNINLLMTNMTFTKGVGTPKYMAPEILNKEKFIKSADIFQTFKFPWKIAEFVMSGKRLERRENIYVNLYEIIQACWVREKANRVSIDEIVNMLII